MTRNPAVQELPESRPGARPLRSVRPAALIVLALFGATFSGRSAAEDSQPPAQALDIVFALDTTGSMGSMIDGAKKYIWGIASKLRSQGLDVRFGLVAYRDRNDAYITQAHPFAAQMLAVEQRLRGFEAAGGGDTPEAVNQALMAAVGDLEWRHGARRIVFLVGDAPPHEEDPEALHYLNTAQRAVSRNIVIHTLLCGSDQEAMRVWKEIAQAAGGRFIQLDLARAVATPETPYDSLLRSLQRQLAETVVPFGTEEERRAVEDQLAEQSHDSAHQTAERLGYQEEGDQRVAPRDDLLDRYDEGSLELEHVADDQLPENVRRRSVRERHRYLEDQSARRRGLWSEVKWLTTQRQAFLEAEHEQRGEAFDSVIAELASGSEESGS